MEESDLEKKCRKFEKLEDEVMSQFARGDLIDDGLQQHLWECKPCEEYFENYVEQHPAIKEELVEADEKTLFEVIMENSLGKETMAKFKKAKKNGLDVLFKAGISDLATAKNAYRSLGLSTARVLDHALEYLYPTEEFLEALLMDNIALEKLAQKTPQNLKYCDQIQDNALLAVLLAEHKEIMKDLTSHSKPLDIHLLARYYKNNMSQFGVVISRVEEHTEQCRPCKDYVTDQLLEIALKQSLISLKEIKIRTELLKYLPGETEKTYDLFVLQKIKELKENSGIVKFSQLDDRMGYILVYLSQMEEFANKYELYQSTMSYILTAIRQVRRIEEIHKLCGNKEEQFPVQTMETAIGLAIYSHHLVYTMVRKGLISLSIDGNNIIPDLSRWDIPQAYRQHGYVRIRDEGQQYLDSHQDELALTVSTHGLDYFFDATLLYQYTCKKKTIGKFLSAVETGSRTFLPYVKRIKTLIEDYQKPFPS